jgi:colanic acid/amylovoran biosynthesis glycosyltransferase
LSYFVEKYNLHKNVFFHGALSSSEVKDYMGKADILLLSSVCEGIANVVIEAMALNVPVISTCAGGMGEVIIDGHNGILVDCYDQNAIISGIERILNDRELSIKMCENARNTIKDSYTIKNQTEIYLKEYN